MDPYYKRLLNQKIVLYELHICPVAHVVQCIILYICHLAQHIYASLGVY